MQPLPRRYQVKCKSRDGRLEEVLMIPEAVASNLKLKTVSDLVECVRNRVRCVPFEDIVDLELDGGSRLHKEDLLAQVVREGDRLCTVQDKVRKKARSTEQGLHCAGSDSETKKARKSPPGHMVYDDPKGTAVSVTESEDDLLMGLGENTPVEEVEDAASVEVASMHQKFKKTHLKRFQIFFKQRFDKLHCQHCVTLCAVLDAFDAGCRPCFCGEGCTRC